MKLWKTLAGVTIATAMLAGAAKADDYAVYRVEASDVDEINLRICHSAQITIRGDGDTDLDFYVYGPNGNLVFRDVDGTDWTVVNLRPGRRGCVNYKLYVQNHGGVFNRYAVDMVDA